MAVVLLDVEGEYTRLHEPTKSKRRGVSIAVTIAATEESSGPPEERELRGFVRAPSGAIVHRFERCLAPGETTTAEELTLRPGRYMVSAVLEDPDGGSPRAALHELTVPDLP